VASFFTHYVSSSYHWGFKGQGFLTW